MAAVSALSSAVFVRLFDGEGVQAQRIGAGNFEKEQALAGHAIVSGCSKKPSRGQCRDGLGQKVKTARSARTCERRRE